MYVLFQAKTNRPCMATLKPSAIGWKSPYTIELENGKQPQRIDFGGTLVNAEHFWRQVYQHAKQ